MNCRNQPSVAVQTSLWLTFFFCTFFSSFYLSWCGYAQFDFLYSIWYEPLEIAELANTTGPRHFHKQHFELTDKKEHVRLFAAINRAVHDDITTLSSIQYKKPNGEIIDTMLSNAEIIHLQDVYKVISYFF